MAADTSITITSTELDATGKIWRIGQSVDDRHHTAWPHLHLIPVRAVVEHAAEYGLDPQDSRTVVDWQLHLRFLHHPTPADRLRFCPYRNPPETAWAAHTAAVADIKTRVAIRDPQGLLEQIHRAHDPHPVHILEAVDRVAQTRAHVAHTERQRRG
jgi:hypothetical protein